MLSALSVLPWSRFHKLALGLLLLALPACGLSDYEKQMLETQQREECFREEKEYLSDPLEMPTEKDAEGHETPLANVFLRPPKRISAKPAKQRNNRMWQYPAGSNGGDFSFVELAFANDDKDFAKKVLDTYQATERFQPVEHDPPLPFESWEFNDANYGYSINVTKGSGKQIAIAYIFAKARRDPVRKAINLSLQSLAVDQDAGAARQRYNQNSPWRLQNKPGL